MAEAWRNLTATGARPLAITDCMNFGNPEKPEIMGQFVGCIEGMAEACTALDMPIVSGNVSLYNETTGADGKATPVLPTPAIGAIGLLDDIETMATVAFKAEGECLAVIGPNYPEIGQSLWLREIHGREEGAPPHVDLKDEKLNGEIVRQLIADGAVTAVHDISDGGLLVAVTEMALAGNLGVALERMDTPFAFNESQARYLVTYPADAPLDREKVPFVQIGTVGGDAITVNGSTVTLADLRAAHESFFTELIER